MTDKIISLDELPERSAALRAAGKRIVVTNGCFDLLHVGHVRYLKAARSLGDILIVGLNGDRSVRELKGDGRPLNNEEDRAEVVASLDSVNLVAIFPELRATRFIELAKPDVYVKGGDYDLKSLNSEEHAALKKIGAQVDIVPFEKEYSTSNLISRLQQK